MLDAAILRELRAVTREEQAILDGRTTIDRSLYMQGSPNVVNSKKLLADGKLITLRPNTRFIHFPVHTHDYVEVVYGCSGVVEHIVDGRSIRLKPGELLFLGQRAAHEVCRAGREDIAVNFIVLPEFFRDTLSARRPPPCGSSWWTACSARGPAPVTSTSRWRTTCPSRTWRKTCCSPSSTTRPTAAGSAR